ncbi:MAG: hypothetical protein IH862_00615 [Chloroflexi bacterium]|nr:hypothetical protein [Chloroflexota bacterium]
MTGPRATRFQFGDSDMGKPSLIIISGKKMCEWKLDFKATVTQGPHKRHRVAG